MSNHNQYANPLITRYASTAMSQIWSAQKKHSTWRKLWVALAEAQQELGLDITDQQLSDLKASIDDIDFEAARAYEQEKRHDVMAHVHAYGDQCPSARGIIHLGATSCYVTDNTDLILLRESLQLVRKRLVKAISHLARFASAHRDQPCLGFTHLQPAQPTTVGKRATLWCYDLVLDLHELEQRLSALKFRGVKGTTGTQASFLNLFQGDHDKVKKLDRLVAEKMEFSDSYAVTGQTYSRKIDTQILSVLGGIAESAHKLGTDLRILQHRKEMEEPFEKHQIGSSAMAYKRNPMRSERMCSLGRFVMNMTANAQQTMATQWLERTLDDSANRRLALPQAFLAIDAVLILCADITSGLVVYPKVLERNLQQELPFMATEEILMAAVQSGGDRQDLHERIRVHSQEAAREVKEQGRPNDLIERLQADPAFAAVDLSATLDVSRYYGRAPEQVDEFLETVYSSIQNKYGQYMNDPDEEIRV